MKLLCGTGRHIVEIFETEIERDLKKYIQACVCLERMDFVHYNRNGYRNFLPARNNEHKYILINLNIKHKNIYWTNTWNLLV